MKRHLLLYFALVLMVACKKNNEGSNGVSNVKELPPITTEGNGTFGCRLNGEVFLPETPPAAILGEKQPEFYSIFYTQKRKYYLGGVYKEDKNSSTIELGMNIDSIGFKAFILNNTKTNGAYVEKGVSYKTDSVNIGQINFLRFDTIAGVASGTFFYTVVKGNGDTIKVTDGRFDLPIHFE